MTSKTLENEMLGAKFGKLTVVKRSWLSREGGNVVYFCLCDCGLSVMAEASLLRNGHITSCGCDKEYKTKCKEGKPDCCSYNNGSCVCLTDTNFDYGCPFYKTTSQRAEENKETKKYLLSFNDLKEGLL